MIQMPAEEEKRWQEVFAILKELSTDVKRLWQRVGQTPYSSGGQQTMSTLNHGDTSAGGSIGP